MGCGSSRSASRGLLPHPQVETNYGVVEGKRLLLPDGKEVANVFLGCPFAKPPIGHLRFKKPEPPARWNGILITRRYRPRAVQTRTPWDALDVGRTDENCLYLNIIAPARKNESYRDGYAVLLYIHAQQISGFAMDSSAKYDYRECARLLVRYDVIVVTISYRLGYLGFLCLDDKHCKGNFGMFDQVMALRFVKENIAAFGENKRSFVNHFNAGGNPNQITVFGQSAGSVSTGLLSISPVSRDLFNQAILMAGFPECSWAVNDRSYAIEISRRKALKLGFRRISIEKEWTDEENAACADYLRTLPANRFGITMLGEFGLIKELRLRMAPVYDDEFLPVSIKQLSNESPPKTKIVGCTANEVLLSFRRLNGKYIDQLITQTHSKIEYWAKQRGIEMPMTIEAFRTLYGVTDILLKDKRIVKRTIVKMFSEFVNESPMHSHVLKSLERQDVVYRYLFDHHNKFITSYFNALLPFSAATHATEIPLSCVSSSTYWYIFNVNVFMAPFRKTAADRKVQTLMTKMFTNFAKFGNPNSSDFDFKWEPATYEKAGRHLVIRPDPVMKENVEAARMDRMSAAIDAMSM
ncbi:Carboxylic ester hydrolase [Aphelenchoides besseyi]|nr:Carboxylic ester hydrolase [Aphelenchoides besseyi]KAI6237896.1 Carboxylic ester hydrolase [Aphelenchoides besseyi]